MQTPQIVYAARSDKGRARRNNEDNLYCCGTFLTDDIRNLPFRTEGRAAVPAVFAVFDGIGGEHLGEYASLTAVLTLKEHAANIAGAGPERNDEAVRVFVAETNRRIRDESEKSSVSMGTTMVLAVVDKSGIRAYSIGDSRIYVLDRDGFRQVNTDQTLAMRKVAEVDYRSRSTTEQAEAAAACIGIPVDNGAYSGPDRPAVPLTSKPGSCSLRRPGDMVPDQIEQIHVPNSLLIKPLKFDIRSAHRGRDNITIIAAII